MALLSETILVDVSIALITLSAIIYAYFKWSYTYWQRKNVPYLEPSFPFGDNENPLNRKVGLGVKMKQFYDEFKRRGDKHGGIYTLSTPMYLPIKPEYVKNIMSKDFQYFVDRGVYHNEKDDPISAHLFAIGGSKWRNLRTKLTPTFTSGKMKAMFQTLVDCGHQLEEAMEKHQHAGDAIDIKDLSGCFTTDVIGSCAFGLECNSFKDPNAPFRVYGKKIFQRTKFRSLKGTFLFAFPNLAKSLGMKAVPKDVASFYMKVIEDTVSYREKNDQSRKDFLQLLMDLQDNSEDDNGEGKKLTIEEMAAQSFVFFLAGFETSSTTMTFCLYELALNQKIQDKVRDEINTVLAKHDGKITYDSTMEMKYLGQVIDETLRKYPPVTAITRRCVKDYKIPDEDVVLEAGTNVFISVMGLHYDPDYHNDPERFDPERFNDQNKKKIHPFTYIPFGEGPRICIGLRFGIMQTKVGLVTLLRKYKFTLSPKTETPIVLDSMAIIPTARGGIYLDATKI